MSLLQAKLPELPPAMGAFSYQALQTLKELGLLAGCLRAAIMASDLSTIEISEAEKNQLISQYCNQKRISDQVALEAHIQATCTTFAVFVRELVQPLQFQRYAQQSFGHKAEAKFLDSKEGLDQVVYSLLRVRDPKLARELYLRLEQHEATFP